MYLFLRIVLLLVHSFIYFYISDGGLIYLIERYGIGDLKCTFKERILKTHYYRYYSNKKRILFFLVIWVARIGSVIHIIGLIMALLSCLGVFDVIMIAEIASFYIETDLSVFILTSWLLGIDILIEVLK